MEAFPLQIAKIFIEGLPIRLAHKPIFDVDFMEERNHIFCLVVRIVDFLYSIEDHHDDYFMRHDPSLLQKWLIAFLNTLDRVLQHVLRLAVRANTNRQFNPSFRGPLEKRQ